MHYYQLISFVLWMPFLLVALISGIMFAVSGYRSGVWRALLAFAATIVAAVVSMFVSGFVGWLLSGPVLNALPIADLETAGMFAGVIRVILRGVVQNVIAMVLFFLLMLVTTIIFRSLSRRIKPDSMKTEKKLNKLAGMLTGLACAVIYTILLLLPLYGSLAAYVPAAEQVIGLELAPQRAAMQILDAAGNHPLVAVSELPPFSAVYDGAAGFSFPASGAVSIPEVADMIDQTIVLLENLQYAPEDQRGAACMELISYLRENLAGERWVYDLSMKTIDQFRESIPVSDGVLSACFDELDMSRTEFEDNVNALLDFALYALENDGYAIAMEGDWGRLYGSGIIQKAGALANYSEQAVAVKNLLMLQVATDLCGDDPKAIQSFYERYRLERITDPAQQLREAEALMVLMGFGTSSPAEFFVRHPSLGQEKLSGIIEAYGMKQAMGLGDDWVWTDGMALPALLEDPALRTRVLTLLGSYADRPISGTSFQDTLMLAAEVYEVVCMGANYYYPSCTAAELAGALELIGRDSCANGRCAAGGEVWDLFVGYGAAAQEVPELSKRNAFPAFESTLVFLGAVKDGALPDHMEGYYENQEPDLHWHLSCMVESDVLLQMAKRMVEDQGRDPLGLRQHLTKAQRKALAAYIEELNREITQEDMDTAWETVGSFTLIDENGVEHEISLDEPDEDYEFVYAGSVSIFTPEERIEILCDLFGL